MRFGNETSFEIDQESALHQIVEEGWNDLTKIKYTIASAYGSNFRCLQDTLS